jgi:hypothetical protein
MKRISVLLADDRPQGSRLRENFVPYDASDLPLVEETFRAGATGFVHKVGGTEETLKAIRAVTAGETYITPLIARDLVSSLMTGGPHATSRETALTARQRQILQLLAEGKTMKEAAIVRAPQNRIISIRMRITNASRKYAGIHRVCASGLLGCPTST